MANTKKVKNDSISRKDDLQAKNKIEREKLCLMPHRPKKKKKSGNKNQRRGMYRITTLIRSRCFDPCPYPYRTHRRQDTARRMKRNSYQIKEGEGVMVRKKTKKVICDQH
jgi:hypothetical protein